MIQSRSRFAATFAAAVAGAGVVSAALFAGGLTRAATAAEAPRRGIVFVGLVSNYEARTDDKESVWLVGAHDPARGWRTDAQAHVRLRPGTRFAIQNLRGEVTGQVTIRTVESGQEVGGWLATGRRTGAHTVQMSELAVALAGATTMAARPPRPQSLQSAVYQRTLAERLRMKGLKNIRSARLTQHVRLDLNGDGIEEAVLVAHSRAAMGNEARALAGDYALAAVRMVSRNKGKPLLLPLAEEAYVKPLPYSAPRGFTLLGCPDINADGKREIVLHARYFEGESVEVYSFDGVRVRRVLQAGWGV